MKDFILDFPFDIRKNEVNRSILSRWRVLDLPDAWLVAGCLFQTIWNTRSGRLPGEGIKDYDIFYFDSADLSATAEEDVQIRVQSLLADLGVIVEVANQARVHLWYPQHFGKPYPKLASSKDGIDRFLVQETCVGIRPDEHYAPFGLEGTYAGILTPNPLTPHADLFDAKAESYRKRWQWLTI